MRFAEFTRIYWFFFISGALTVFYIWAFYSRKRYLRKFAQKELLSELSVSINAAQQKIKACMRIAGISICLFALMRPQWGFHWEEVKRKGLDILIALDTSKSMLAEDIKPNRLARAKLALRDFAGKLQGDRIGLIAFSGSAFLECPLTVDYGGFLISLDAIDTAAIPKGGTSLSGAIKEALRSYEGGQKKYKVLVIITDGEDHQGRALQAAEEAKKEGITVFCIGIGTKEGELIPLATETGQKEFLKDRQGNVVKSRLDETTLERIALTTGGSYVRAASTEFGLELLYKEKLAKMEKRELEGKMNKRFEERFQIPLALALVLFFIEPLLNEKRNPKKNVRQA